MKVTVVRAAGVVLFLGLTLYWIQRRSSPGPRTSPLVADAPHTTLSSPPQDLSRQLGALEARQRRLDDTVWAQELRAGRYEAVFIKLWDDLRTQPGSWTALERFSFGQLIFGALGDPIVGEQQVASARFHPPIQRWTPESWRSWLANLKSQGWRLEQSEWRHAHCEFATNGSVTSIFAITLHVLRPEPEERVILRGDLRVHWQRSDPGLAGPRSEIPAEAGLAEPFPEVINATDLELLSRRGETPFHHGVVADLTPEAGEARTLEPMLQLYDLDSDGLSEIVVANRNRVYWNQGQGAFRQDALFEHPPAGVQAGLIADFDGDGGADFLAAVASGLELFHGDPDGHFRREGLRVWSAPQALVNPSVLTAGDVDHDGDLDIWLAQYKVPYQGGQMPTPYYDANDGYPSFLLLNDGAGRLADRTEAAGLAPKRFRRTYSASFFDLDQDGDLDLLVVSDFAGAEVYLNQGQGRFAMATHTVLDESQAFGMSHRIGDFNLDGTPDWLVIGMNSFAAQRLDDWRLCPPGAEESRPMRSRMSYGNRLFFGTGTGFHQTPLGAQVARTGWSWGVTTGDFDNDGDEDLFVVNGHISGLSAQDYETQYWRHDIYTGTSQENPTLEAFFRALRTRHQGAGESYGGFEKKRLFLNEGGRAFQEAGYLLGVAREEDSRNAVSDDLDGDGKLELLMTTFQTWPQLRQELHLFANFTPAAGHWIGVHLRESGAGVSPVGAKVVLTTPTSKQCRFVVTGDSYRSQHANTAHFGLGSVTNVNRFEVLWPNGRTQQVLNPVVDRYYSLRAEPGL